MSPNHIEGAEAAYRRAEDIFTAEESAVAAAAPWLRRAVELGGTDYLWRPIHHFYFANDVAAACEWMQAAIGATFPMETAPAILVSPQLFNPYADHTGGIEDCDASVRVVCDQPEVAAWALNTLSPRWSRTTADGVESPTFEDFEAHVAEADMRLHSADYVSDAVISPRGPWIYASVEGQMWGAMARRMITAAIESLLTFEIKTARLEPGDYGEL